VCIIALPLNANNIVLPGGNVDHAFDDVTLTRAANRLTSSFYDFSATQTEAGVQPQNRLQMLFVCAFIVELSCPTVLMLSVSVHYFVKYYF